MKSRTYFRLAQSLGSGLISQRAEFPPNDLLSLVSAHTCMIGNFSTSRTDPVEIARIMEEIAFGIHLVLLSRGQN